MSGKNTTLLRIKEWLNEIATSHRTLLAMTEQEKTQIPLTPFAKGGNDSWIPIFIIIWRCESSMRVYPENNGPFFKGILLEQLTRISSFLVFSSQ